jgi:hypothetical protein
MRFNKSTILTGLPTALQAQNLLKTSIASVEKVFRKHPTGSPSCLQIIETGGIYALEFDEWETDGLFLDNVQQVCRARRVQAVILTVGLMRGNPDELSHLNAAERNLRISEVVVVCENDLGERAEKAMPVIRDVSGKFKAFGEYNAQNPDLLQQKYPRLMPDKPLTEADRFAANAILASRGIIIHHAGIDAANRGAPDLEI